MHSTSVCKKIIVVIKTKIKLATWQRLIDQVFKADPKLYVFVYLDYIIFCAPHFANTNCEYTIVLNLVLSTLRQSRLTLNWEKCKYCGSQLNYLVDKHALRVNPDKICTIFDCPALNGTKQLWCYSSASISLSVHFYLLLWDRQLL